MKGFKNPKFRITAIVLTLIGSAFWLFLFLRDKPSTITAVANFCFTQALVFLAVGIQRKLTNNRIMTLGPIRGKKARQAVAEAPKHSMAVKNEEKKYQDENELLLVGTIWLVISFIISIL